MDHSSYSNANAHPFSDHPLFENPLVLAHATCMILAFVVCYPLAITFATRQKLRTHFIISCIGTGLAILGFLLGWSISPTVNTKPTSATSSHEHMTMGRDVNLSTAPETYGIKLDRSAHSAFSGPLLILLFIEVGCGIYSSFVSPTSTSPLPYSNLSWRLWLPRVTRVIHSVLGLIFFLLTYIQIVLGMIEVTESCGSEYFAQCMAHIIMGSTFLWYGTLSLLYLFSMFTLPHGSVPEYYESILITIWGVINSFALHRWGTPWSHQDLQHTSLGVLWWAGGAFGLAINFQTWIPILRERNPMPSIVVALTGLAMSSHSQHHGFAIAVHQFFGLSLIGGAAARLIQIATRQSNSHLNYSQVDQPFGTVNDGEELVMNRPRNRVHSDIVTSTSVTASISILAGFFASLGIMTAGITFMAANENWLNIVTYYIDDASTYINLIVALVFIWLIYIMFLISLVRLSPIHPTSNGYIMALSIDEHEPLHTDSPSLDRRRSRMSSSSSSSMTGMRPSEYLAKRRSTLTENLTNEMVSSANNRRMSWSMGSTVENRGTWPGNKLTHESLDEIEGDKEYKGKSLWRAGANEARELFSADIEMNGLVINDNKL